LETKVKIGYARTSTEDQIAGFEGQIAELTAAGCQRIFREQVSAVGERPQLEAALDYIRDGDILVVTKLDRLARSTLHLHEIVKRLNAKEAGVQVMALGIDTSTATGKLMFGVLASVAEFERDMMLERQLIGIAKAKAEGKYKGRVPTVQRQAAQIRELDDAGVDRAEIARRLGVGRTSVYRVLGMTKDARPAPPDPAAS
jgi:DNA invertase Pin-like site-specific DNA recombinase